MSEIENSKLGTVLSWIFVVIFCLTAWYWGFAIGTTALTDPDTCWLLAVGNWISQHGMPTADPFSATAAQYGGPYVPYQWLSMAAFNILYKAGGAEALLFFTTYAVLSAFYIYPVSLARRLGLNIFLPMVLALLAVSAGSFHFPLRPELFSYMLLIRLVTKMLTAWQTHEHGSGLSGGAPLKAAVLKSQVAAFLVGFLFFLLWANAHSAFVLGLIVAAVHLISPLPEKGKILRDPRLAIFAGAVLATFCTPFGVRLYAYLPGLFFSPMNKYNQELLPLSLHDIFSNDYLPFLFLQILLLGSFVYCGWTLASGRQKWSAYTPVYGVALLALLLVISGDFCRRMIPFAVLVLVDYFICLATVTPFSLESLAEKKPGLKVLGQISAAFRRTSSSHQGFLVVLCAPLLAAALGTNASATIFPCSVPQKSFSFDVPFNAVHFVMDKRPSGNMLNDPQFGDVLIFAQGDQAKVFIDTRFDLYGPQFCHDYFVMANGLPGYEALLEKYKIDWIFFPQRAPIIRRLAKTPGWRTVFQDNAAIIMVKRQL